jgi:hypothetical protein
MPELEPTWDPELHIDRVYRRGRRLRRRRRVAVVAAPAALALLAVFAVGGAGSQSGRPVRVAQGGTLHAPPSGVGGGQDGDVTGSNEGNSSRHGDAADGNPNGNPSAGTPAPSNHSGTPPAAAPAQSRAPGEQATVPAGTQQAAPGPDGSRPSSAAAPTAAPAATCPASALDYSTITDRSAYGRGQQVAIGLVVRNRSNVPCDGPGPCGIGPWATVQNASGAIVWQSHPIAVACTNPAPAPPRLGPGQSTTYAAGTWDQTVCSPSGTCSGQAPPGTYRAVAHRGSARAAAARFTIG